jgi:hypothetical protein
MPYINHKENPDHEPKVGDSFSDLYPWSEVPASLGWSKVKDMEESEALKLALDRVPQAIVPRGANLSVETVSKSQSPGVAWSTHTIVVAYETKTYLFAIGHCNREWELLSRKKNTQAARKQARKQFDQQVEALENKLYQSSPDGTW